MRTAARLASRNRRHVWHAVYVETPALPLTGKTTAGYFASALRLAQEAWRETATLSGNPRRRSGRALCPREHNLGKIVIDARRRDAGGDVVSPTVLPGRAPGSRSGDRRRKSHQPAHWRKHTITDLLREMAWADSGLSGRRGAAPSPRLSLCGGFNAFDIPPIW